MIKAIYILVGLALILGLIQFVLKSKDSNSETVACTMDAMMCSDGSYVGRTGPNCEFVCPPALEVDAEVQAHINEHSDLIVLSSPAPSSVISSPLVISGTARGYWYFEASFPITLTNWDGLIIAQGYATAQGDWMTEDFVPFTASLEFETPYLSGNPDFMKKGALILQKDNPSGMPENDDALEIPVNFAL